MRKKAKVFNLKTHCVNVLRRSFLRSRLRGEFLATNRERRINKRTGNNTFHLKCAGCKKWFTQSDIVVDHREPIVSTKKGWISLDDFAEKLYCPIKNLQAMCKSCHDDKSQKERKERTKI